MANAILTISKITREALRVLENNLTFAKYVARDYDDQYAQAGAKIGDTLRIRKPARYTVTTGPALSVQDHTETEVPFVLQWQDHVDVNFTSVQLALDLDDFSHRVLEPAVSQLANQIDQRGLQLYTAIANSVQLPSPADNTTWRKYLEAGAYMDDEAAPRDNLRSAVIDQWAQVDVVDQLKGLFHDSSEVEDQYKYGTMGISGGFKWSMDQNVATHTTGASVASSVTVNGAGQTGSTLNVSGFAVSTTAAARAGDVFTIAGVNGVNPKSRNDTGRLRYFTVTADADSDGSGNAPLSISPSIVTTGAFQTVTAGPANSAALTWFNTTNGAQSKQNLCFHRDAVQLGCADLPLPDGVDRAARVSDSQLGISLRMIRAYDINQDQFPTRIDVLYGWVVQYPELACRVWG